MRQPDEPEAFDPAALGEDLARIRAKLRRLDGERQLSLQQLSRALAEAERLLDEGRRPPPEER